MSNDNFRYYCAFCHACPMNAKLFERPDWENVQLFSDALGNHWCEEHRHRGKVIDWGYRHGWPELDCETFIISGWPSSWQMHMAVSKNEDIGYIAEAVIEYLDELEAQAS